MAELLVVVVGTTDVSLIPGISIAGPSPEATHYTPALDVEYLLTGRPKTLDVVPVTPDGIPTPAVVTRALTGDLPKLVVDAGSRIPPKIPRVVLGGVPGGDIRRGAMPREAAEEVAANGRLLGRQLARWGRVAIGESIPGGTTTAMAILLALGYDAWGRTSSASPDNPKELKARVVKEALARVKPPLDAVTAASEVGDPVHLAVASIALGVAEGGGEVVLAGGTQMAAAAALYKALGGDVERLAVATTRWILEDKSADFLGLMREVGVRRVYASRSSFGGSRCRGLRAYDRGYVKEGVAMGYALWRAESSGVDPLPQVEAELERLGKCYT
ncbi:nicotinate mononucleotide-dependent phosphoribosyltransferase CobT [Pyrobaculum neutrophilum]|uniref:UPF0284 protein Tneu_0295 n=1 Tax=Pyrobaculum neutrophilum (strain DSM 2338 / JCM 9278 / NBRC 100436 / V24Sta) TaxID=444157 RepID=B1YBB5_PYRNV|nr:TIGR00303 family protein [Pyrobaculum neutrophilum]ACB39246.1 Nicotinate-nucleotide-dimethylbenzimidazole phosphoribosyltransferase [Pyrobaculum neutrophilum V24Sta]